MDEVKRYKLYKAGKLWLIAAVSAITLLSFNGSVVAHADGETPTTDTTSSTTQQEETLNANGSSTALNSSGTSDNQAATSAADGATSQATQAQAASETPAAGSEASAAASGNITSTPAAAQQAALSQINAARASAAASNSAISQVALNSDLNAWAQARANEMAVTGTLLGSDATLYSAAPAWVSADGQTSTNLEQSPNYKAGDTVSVESYYAQKNWFLTKETKKFLGYYAINVDQFTTQAINDWISDQGKPNGDFLYSAMASPYANVVGFAYSYNATTGFTAVVLETAYLPDKTETETKTVTRTIKYVDRASGKDVSKPTVQTVTLTRVKSTSQVDGSVTYSDWTAGPSQFGAVTAPDLSADGYSVGDPATVAALDVTGDTEDNTPVIVNYDHAAPSKTETKTITRTVNYLDRETGAVVSPAQTQTVTFTRTGTTDEVTGATTYTDWTSDAATFAVLDSPDLSTKGYTAPDIATAPAQTVAADDQNPTVDVYYDHATTTTPETKTITRTINYLDRKTGAIVSPAQTQTVTYTRTGTTDKVTGTTTYTDWTSDNATFAAIVSPDLSGDGYGTASEASVADKAVAANDTDVTTNVYYDHATATTPETKTITRTINYLDRETGAVVSPVQTQTVTYTRTGTTDEATGTTTYTDWASDNATFVAITSPDLSAKGYTTASQASVAAQTVTADDQNTTVNVYYDHATATTPETKTITRTINYLDRETGAVVSPAQTQTVTYTRTGTTDKVMGATIYTKWASVDPTFAAIASPDLSGEGYTAASLVLVAAQSVTSSSQNTTVNVYYDHATASMPETKTITRTINYLDRETGAVVSPAQTQTVTYTRTGTTDKVTGTTSYTKWASADPTYAAIASPDLSGEGYTAASQASVAAQTVTADDQNTTVNVYYDHAMTTTTETKTITRTINYVDTATGTSIKTPTVQTVTFSRTVTTDNVTGAKTVSDWTADQTATFASVETPEIVGYTALTEVAPAQTVTADSQNSEVTVEYNAVPVATKDDAAAVSVQPQPVIPANVPNKTVAVTPTEAPAKQSAKALPQTDNDQESGLIGVGVASLLSLFGLAGVMKRRQTR